jgi:hypothetical protein
MRALPAACCALLIRPADTRSTLHGHIRLTGGCARQHLECSKVPAPWEAWHAVLAAKGTRPRRPRFPSCTFVADLQDTAWLRRLRGCFGPPLMVLAFFCGVMQSVDARICWQVPPVRALKAASAGCTLCRRGQERGWMLPLKRDLSNLHHVSVGAQLAMPCVAGLARCEMGIRLYFSHS